MALRQCATDTLLIDEALIALLVRFSASPKLGFDGAVERHQFRYGAGCKFDSCQWFHKVLLGFSRDHRGLAQEVERVGGGRIACDRNVREGARKRLLPQPTMALSRSQAARWRGL